MVNLLKALVSPAAPRASISAGHGVHRSNCKSAVGAAPCGRPSAPPHGRPHRGAPTAAASRPSPAGHGVHRSNRKSVVGAAPCGRPSVPPHGRPHGSAPTAAASRPSPAGHGVHRSKSTVASAVPTGKIRQRGHRGHRAGVAPLARAARNPASSVPSVSCVVNPSSAGHGLHRPFSNHAAPAGIRAHLRSSAASTALSAGHGVHRSIFDSRPALR